MRTRSIRHSTLLISSLLLCAPLIWQSCASSSGSAGGARSRTDARADGDAPAQEVPGQFPSKKELEDLADTEIPEEYFQANVAEVESWKLSGPFPERVAAEAYQDGSAWSTVLSDAARSRAGLVVPTEAMHCMARQLGEFYLEHEAAPSDSLRDFMRSRCGCTVTDLKWRFHYGSVPPDADEAYVFENWQAAVRRVLFESLVGGPYTAGIWFGRRDDFAIAMVVTGRRSLHLEPVLNQPDAEGRIVIRGESLGEAEGISAAITHGKFGVEECETVGEPRPPRFHFACQTEPGDREAWISVSLMPPGRILGKMGVELLVFPSGKPQNTYRRPRYAKPHPVEDPDEFGSELVSVLNQIRAEAGLNPLEEVSDQSELATELAPHFFGALFGESEPAVADLVALGMMAGWYVDGILQSGGFVGEWVLQSNDVSQLLSESLMRPLGREVLLSEGAEKVAVGPVVHIGTKGKAIAALVGTYSFFSEADHNANARTVFEKLKHDRAGRGRAAPRHLPEVAQLSMFAASQVQSGEDADDVLQDAMERASLELGRPVTGWYAELSDLQDLRFPSAFLDETSLAVAIGVSHVQPKDEPWGRYVVMLIVSSPQGRRL